MAVRRRKGAAAATAKPTKTAKPAAAAPASAVVSEDAVVSDAVTTAQASAAAAVGNNKDALYNKFLTEMSDIL